MTMNEIASTFRAPRVALGTGGGVTDSPAKSPGPRVAKTPKSHKAALLVGVVLALALANTEAAPLVDALLVAGIVYQVIQITGGKSQ